MSSIDGLKLMAPAQVLALARQAGEVGQPVDREVDLARRAAELEAPDLGLELRVEGARLEQPEERPPDVGRGEDGRRPRSPRRYSSATPVARPPRTRIRATGASVRISAPRARAATAMAFADAAGAALGDAPGAERAVDLAHVVVEQHVGGARRADARGTCR